MSSFKCPSCGRELKVIPLAHAASTNWKAGTTFALGTGVPKGATYSKETPVVDMSGLEAGFKTPLFQSSITGLAGGALAVIGVLWQGWHWTTPIVAVVIVFGASWYMLLTGNRRLLSVHETVDRPTEVEQAATFNVEITETLEGQAQRMVFAQFPAKESEVKRFAIAALNHRLTVHGGHKLSRGTFEKLRDECLDRGLLTWVNPHAHNQGCQLSRVGQRVFEHLSN